MIKFYTALLLCFFTLTTLSAQCELSAEISDVSCDPFTGDTYFRLTATGSEGSFQIPDYGLDFPLPFEEEFSVPFGLGDSLVLYLESGSGDDVCRDTVVLVPPAGCAAGGGGDCSVYLAPSGPANCGVFDSIAAVVTGTGPFTYDWNTGDTTATIATVPGHFSYAVTVTDADGCVSVAHYSLDSNPFFVHIESSGDPCTGELPSLTATVFGADGPFTYSWSTGDSTQTIAGVDPEVLYEVTVTDANGCSASGFGLYHPGIFTEWLHINGPQSISCAGDSVVLSVENPDPNFIYTWANGVETLTGSTISVTSGGYWEVTGVAQDAPDCQAFGGIFISDFNFEEEDLAIVSVSENCGPEACFYIMDATSGQYLFHPIVIEWSSPTGGAFTEEFGALCTSEPGVYQASVITPCDTIILFTEVKDGQICAELCGTIMMDVDEDCVQDDTEPQLFYQWPMIITNDSTNASYFLFLDFDGNFCTEVPAGSYQVKMLDLTGMSVSMSCTESVASMSVAPGGVDGVEVFVRMAAEPAGEETTSTGRPNAAAVPSLRVYPNPSPGGLRIDLGQVDLTETDLITLYDGMGRVADRVTVAALPAEWRPRSVSSGVYHLVVTGAEGRLKARSSVVFR